MTYQLAKAPLPDQQPLQVEFSNMDVLTITPKQWTLYFDGSYTQHGSGSIILFVTPEGHTIPRSYRLMFPCTNNIAQYEFLVTQIKVVMEWRITKLRVNGDSQLVINQINDDYQTKDDKLIPYKRMVDDFKKYFVHITYEQIPILGNRVVDAMATIASLLQIPDKQSL